MFTEYFSENGKENSLRNLPYIPNDLKATFPNINSIETKEIVRNGETGSISEYKLSNNDRIKSIILIGDRGTYNTIVYVSHKQKQSDTDFENYYKSLSDTVVESFEVVRGK